MKMTKFLTTVIFSSTLSAQSIALANVRTIEEEFNKARESISISDLQTIPMGYMVDPWHKQANSLAWDTRYNRIVNDPNSAEANETFYRDTCKFFSMNTYAPPEQPKDDKLLGLLRSNQTIAVIDPYLAKVSCSSSVSNKSIHHFDNVTAPSCRSLNQTQTIANNLSIKVTGKFRHLIGIDPFSYAYPNDFDSTFRQACALESQAWGYDVCPAGTREKYEEISNIEIRKSNQKLLYRLERGSVVQGYGVCQPLRTKHYCYANFVMPYPKALSPEGKYYFSLYSGGRDLSDAKRKFVEEIGAYHPAQLNCSLLDSSIDPTIKQNCISTAKNLMKCTTNSMDVLKDNLKMRGF